MELLERPMRKTHRKHWHSDKHTEHGFEYELVSVDGIMMAIKAFGPSHSSSSWDYGALRSKRIGARK